MKPRSWLLLFLISLLASYAAERLYSAYIGGYFPLAGKYTATSQAVDRDSLLVSEQPNDNNSATVHIPQGSLSGRGLSATIYFEQPIIESAGLTVYDDTGPSNNSNSFKYLKRPGSFHIRFDEEKDMADIAFYLQLCDGNRPTHIVLNEQHGWADVFAPGGGGVALRRFVLILLMIFGVAGGVYACTHGAADAVFKYRYVIAVSVFLFLVMNQYHMSSIGAYDASIQHMQGSEYVRPLFGAPRGIRSDEWVVNTPQRLAAQYGDPYSSHNPVLRGTLTSNAAGTSFAYAGAAFAYPFMLGYFLLGPAYGLSVWWVGVLLVTFMASFEMCRLITGDRRLLSLAGASMITFSAYFQWWSYVAWITSMQVLIVCYFYFLRTDALYKRALWALGIASALAYFIVNIYPAWQVPSGYLFLLIFIWLSVRERQRIKALKKADVAVFAAAVALAGVAVFLHLRAASDYLGGITNTVYPGARVELGGGNAKKLQFGYLSLLLPFFPSVNASELSGFLTFFPVPMILSIWYMARRRRPDPFILLINGFTLVMLTYTVAGWPEPLANLTLMSYSSAARADDIIGFAQLYLLIYMLSRPQRLTNSARAAGLATLAGLAPIINGVIICHKEMYQSIAEMMPYIIAYTALAAAAIYAIIWQGRRLKAGVCAVLLALTALGGISVNPLSKGLDSIYSKPVAAKVRELATNTDEKWLAIHHNLIAQQLLVSCGASTLNSTNNYPNMELWRKLDPAGRYEDIYNRYAHVLVDLTEGPTTFEAGGSADVILLHLSYADLQPLNVKYIYANAPLVSVPGGAELALLYCENGVFIYGI